MNLSSIGTTTGVPTSQAQAGTAASIHQLNKSLRKGDLEGAQQAYASILKNPPAGATWNPDGAFAELGKALVKGDIEGARTVAADAIRAARGHSSGGTSAPAPAPEPTNDPLPPDAESYASSGSLSIMA